MPRFVIERQYLVPIYEHILIEAPSLAEACRDAVDESKQPWGDDAKTDYENARCLTIQRAVQLPEQTALELRAGVDTHERALSHLLYSAGLDPLAVPTEFADSEETDPLPGFV